MKKKTKSVAKKRRKAAAPKKKATPKSAVRKSAKRVASPQKKEMKAADEKKTSVDEWLGIVRNHIARTAEDGTPTGACSVPDPNGGPNLCVEMTQEACTSPAVRGTWVGGNC